ncbi:hypothetical protein BHM03_00060817 [Ensete ventricosum]|nr:hypothetical protein BHM03_00060817 [Ensete ventricosum]
MVAVGWRAARVAAHITAGGEQWLATAIKEESKVAVKVGWKRLDNRDGSGWEWMLQRRGGSGYVAATRATSGGCAWPRKDSNGRREEAVGTSMFGATAATGEMGIWWPAAATRRKMGWATASSNDDREGQRRSRGGGSDGGWAAGGRGLETTIMAEGVAAACSLQSRNGEEEGGSGVRRGVSQGTWAAGNYWGHHRCD